MLDKHCTNWGLDQHKQIKPTKVKEKKNWIFKVATVTVSTHHTHTHTHPSWSNLVPVLCSIGSEGAGDPGYGPHSLEAQDLIAKLFVKEKTSGNVLY